MRRVVFLLPLLIAACGVGSGITQVPARFDEDDIEDHLERLAQPAVPPDSARAARRARYAAEAFRAAELMPVLASSFFVGGRVRRPDVQPDVDPAQAHVLAYLPGRHPRYAPELVLVAAGRDAEAGAAVLEVARALAQQARFMHVPERTVLFALWNPSRSGADGLAEYLANPTWAPAQIARVLLVAPDEEERAESAALLGAQEIPYELVTVPLGGFAEAGARAEVLTARAVERTGRLAEALYARTLAAAGSLVGDTATVLAE